jgi:hypothetical protein
MIEEWLSEIGLELKPSKTRLAHTLDKHEDEESGFNFLGFKIRQYLVGKYQSGRIKAGLLGYKTIITPTKESQKTHLFYTILESSGGGDTLTNFNYFAKGTQYRRAYGIL